VHFYLFVKFIVCTFVENKKSMKGIRIYVTIPILLNEQLEARVEAGSDSISEVVSQALFNYFNTSTKEESPSGVLTQKDLDKIKKLLDFQPIVPMSYPFAKLEHVQVTTHVLPLPEEEQKGITMPDMSKVKERPIPDPDIKHSFHLGEIMPGPGVVGRLRAAGINPLDITKAKRAKGKGLEYNKELEKYFDLL
jgi:ribosomal protein L11